MYYFTDKYFSFYIMEMLINSISQMKWEKLLIGTINNNVLILHKHTHNAL